MKKTLLSMMLVVSGLLLATYAYAAPAAPVMTLSTSGTHVSVTWTPVPDATGYKLLYAPYPYQGEQTIEFFDMGTETQFSADLWDGAAFYVAIKAYDSQSTSEYSNTNYFVLDHSVSGTASEGALLGNRPVKLYDSNGTVVEGATDAQGYYRFDVATRVPPFLVAINGESGLLASFAAVDGRANINPITTEVIALAAGTTDIAGLLADLTAEQLAAISENFGLKCAQATASLRPILPEGVKAENFFFDAIAGGERPDSFFDSHSVAIHQADGITVTSKENNGQVLLRIPVSTVQAMLTAPLPRAGAHTQPPLMGTTGIPVDIKTAAIDHAPTIYLHPDEKYFPATIKWYTEFENFIIRNGTWNHPLHLFDYPTRLQLMGNTNKAETDSSLGGVASNMQVTTAEWFKKGMQADTEKGNWPAYIAIAKVHDNSQNDDYLIVQYNTFYSFNEFSTGFGNPHYADWERASVFLKKDQQSGQWNFLGIMTKAHEHHPVSTKHPLTFAGKPIVFAAKHGHGTYVDYADSPNLLNLNNTCLDNADVTRVPATVPLYVPNPLLFLIPTLIGFPIEVSYSNTYEVDGRFDLCDFGVEWELSKKDSGGWPAINHEFIRYVEYTTPSMCSLNNATKNVIYEANWLNYYGRWGQDEHSPWTNINFLDGADAYNLYGELYHLFQLATPVNPCTDTLADSDILQCRQIHP